MGGALELVHFSAIRFRGKQQDPLEGSSRRNSLNAEARPAGGGAARPLDPSHDQKGDLIDMRVAQLLCSRLCHDLVGSSGAIHNGIELMSEQDGADAAALSLIAASSAHLNNRLAFYRVAFGLSGGANRMMTLAEARDLANGVIAGPRVEWDWRTDAPDGVGERLSFPMDEIRLALGLVLVGADALLKGGALCVRWIATAAGIELTVVARGVRAAVPETLAAAMNPDVSAESLTSRTVHGYLAATLARRLGTAVDIAGANADEVTLKTLLPRPWKAHTIPFPTHGNSL
jgi:histidine phosphotransferase ChpT